MADSDPPLCWTHCAAAWIYARLDVFGKEALEVVQALADLGEEWDTDLLGEDG